jgi:hypothetical protein
MKELDKLYREASSPLWRAEGSVSSVSFISVVIVLMTLCTTHGVSNAFVDELLKYLSSTLLLKQNCLPTSFYLTKSAVQKMGLEYRIIHCYRLGHVLFRSEYENLNSCPHPKCNLSYWIPMSNTIFTKVLRHFQLIPRLKRIFKSPAISKLLK